MYKNLNLGALGFQLPFRKTIDAAKIGGFQGIDVDTIEMEELVRVMSVEGVKRLLLENDLKLGGWGLPVNFRADKETCRRDLQKLPRYAKIACELGCNRAFTWILPFSDELPFKENFERHVERLRPAAEILEDQQCFLGLEFVAPKTSRIGHNYEFIHTMDGILKLCEAIGTGNLGLLLDSWHWYTSHGTLDELRRLKGEQVIYVHINDAPAGIPIDEQIDNVRRLPGETGVIDLVGFLKALREAEYEGPVTPEPFSKKLREMPVSKAVQMVGESLDRVWKAAGLE